MEISGVINRPIQSFFSGDFYSYSNQLSFSDEVRLLDTRDSKVSVKWRKFSGFSDTGHLQYYVSPRCGGKKEKSLETVSLKKKLIKGLSKRLSMFPEMGFVEIGSGDNGNTISEVAEVLLDQLQQIKEEEKEMKRKKKEKKAKLKVAKMKARGSKKSSSSSSSESSDSECGEVIDMSHMRNQAAFTHPALDEPQKAAIQAEKSLCSTSLLTEELKTVENVSRLSFEQESCYISYGVDGETAKRIEPKTVENLSTLSCEQESRCTSNGIDGETAERIEPKTVENQSTLSCEQESRCISYGVDSETAKKATQDPKTVENLSRLSCGQENCCSSNGVSGEIVKRIEVCMGGKCRKSGGLALLEEIEERVGIDGAVIGCKCMGKCKYGPNVRVLNGCNKTEKPATKSLCIGVGLEDVSKIVADFFGEEREDLGLMAA